MATQIQQLNAYFLEHGSRRRVDVDGTRRGQQANRVLARRLTRCGSAYAFMSDVASRLHNRVQLTTDGHKVYLSAVEDAFGADVDYAMLVKVSGTAQENETRYSPAKILSSTTEVIKGNPNPKYISTSYVERQNLTMRMHMRRLRA